MFPDETLHDLRWHLFAIVALSRAENKCLFQNLFVSLILCNSLDAVCSVDFSFLALLSNHVANSKCHPLLFEVFKERVCVCVRVSVCAKCKEGMEDESTRTICCCRLRME